MIIAVFLILSVILGMRAIGGIELISESEIGRYLEIPFCQICPAKPLFVLTEVGLGFMNIDYVLSKDNLNCLDSEYIKSIMDKNC